MPKTPEILNKQILTAEEVASDVLKVEQIHLRFNNGAERHYRRIKGSGSGAVLIIPMLDRQTVLLIREYAAGVHRYELQLPKGRIEKDESFIDAANRELKEETGYGSRNLTHINTLTVAPGFMGHETYIILAQDLYEDKLEGDEPEEIEVVPWQIADLEPLVQRKDCTDARSIAALYMAKELITTT